MNCYYIVVHGRLDWDATLPRVDDGMTRPEGFLSHRYVLASTFSTAQEAALRGVREHFDKRFVWLKSKAARLRLEAAETDQVPLYHVLYKLIRPIPGYWFYGGDCRFEEP
jgi:hypothetical protein